jgi:hypothetical protein
MKFSRFDAAALVSSVLYVNHDILAVSKTMKAQPLFHPCGSNDRASVIQSDRQLSIVG